MRRVRLPAGGEAVFDSSGRLACPGGIRFCSLSGREPPACTRSVGEVSARRAAKICHTSLASREMEAGP